MGEVLHEVDFNQLKIENQQYLEKIDEKNQDLLRLKLMAGNVQQILNMHKVWRKCRFFDQWMVAVDENHPLPPPPPPPPPSRNLQILTHSSLAPSPTCSSVSALVENWEVSTFYDTRDLHTVTNYASHSNLHIHICVSNIARCNLHIVGDLAYTILAPNLTQNHWRDVVSIWLLRLITFHFFTWIQKKLNTFTMESERLRSEIDQRNELLFKIDAETGMVGKVRRRTRRTTSAE